MGKRISTCLAGVTVAVYFFRLTRGALHVALSPDDITNIYRSWSYPVSLLLRANLLFFETSPFYRPLAHAWYRAMFYFAGTDPRPYHTINLFILAANAFLTYGVARRLSGSREIGWLAALIACYHTQFNGLYFDTGFVFDVLCYFFYFAALLLYFRIRQEGKYPGVRPLAAICTLYVCALNSKEMAITLPLFLALYEWLYHGGPRDTAVGAGEMTLQTRAQKAPARFFPAWLLHEGRGVLATGTIALLFAAGRATGEFSLMRNPAYRPEISWERLMLTTRQFLGDLFFVPGRFTPATVLLVWVALAMIAWVSQSKTLRFAWLFLMLSPAPVAFVEPRGAAQYYIPLFGWSLFFAVALSGLCRYLLRQIRGPAGLWAARLRPPALLAIAILVQYPYYKATGHNNVTSVTIDGAMLQSLVAQTVALHPALPDGSRLLLLNETDDPAWDTFLPAVRLNYRDPDIRIDRARKMGRNIEEQELALYDEVLDYNHGRLTTFHRPPDPRLQPVVLETEHGPEIFHADWSRVTEQTPAQRGEILIVKMAGLGTTVPEIAAGQPFPRDPTAAVIYHIGASVNGDRTQTFHAFGWPGAVNTYRVDIRVPKVLRPGAATLQLTVRGLAAPPARFPVR